jgi:uncharacterized FAD-dependent dehydrogenase
MKDQYDLIIIGGGIGGLLTAYKAIKNNPKLKIAIFESGKDLKDRACPMIAHKTKKCVHCEPCAIMRGLAGAGAFSDGKYIIGTEFGGWLTNFLDKDIVFKYIKEANSILEHYGATTSVYYPNDELKLECLKHDLHMLQAQLKHLGTEENYNTMLRLIEDLKTKVEIYTLTTATAIDKDSSTVTVKTNKTTKTVKGENIVFAVGRAGSQFLTNWCKENDIELINNQVDIGVRVELPRLIWKSFADKIYEPKILYRSKKYGDITRMFCFNDGGHVIIENTDGIYSVNGHSYKKEELKTENSNFALLSTIKFTQPFNEPIQYAKDIAGIANKISGGSVLVQRFGDLIKGRRSDESRIAKSTTRPTLNAVAGDLSLCMPKRQLDNIIEMIYALDKVAPGTANEDTLLYGIECKYYSARPKMDNFKLDKCSNIYAVGDGAGITRSLSHAGANGLMVADLITNKTLKTK